MLKEKIVYKDELPINVVTANITEYPIHFHDDMEVVYVLDGSVILRNGYYTYTLKQGDVFILNDREMHSFQRTDEDNLVMMFQMDLTYFSRYYDNLKNNFFVTDIEDDSDESLEVLRTLLARIMMEILQKGYGYEHKVIESTHNLIACLLSDFQYFVMENGRFKNELKNKGNKILAGRLNRITDYMYDNYTRKLTLSEIADREHLSIYYLSHIIKEATGLSFQDLLSYIRVEESERLLLGTNKKIGAIAEETGFSAVRYYIKHFEQWFGMHPLEYRKKYIGKIISRDIAAQYKLATPAEIEEAIRKQVKGIYADYADKFKAKPVIIDIDIYDEFAEVIKKPVSMSEIMERDVNRVLAVYNFDENTGKNLRKIMSRDDLMRIVRNYENEMEFLVRCTGLSGNFRVIRYRMEKENFLAKIAHGFNPDKRSSLRENFINKMISEPNIRTSSYISSDALSVRTIFEGVGAELILIDRI